MKEGLAYEFEFARTGIRFPVPIVDRQFVVVSVALIRSSGELSVVLLGGEFPPGVAVDYNNALSTLWSFGTDEALCEAARVPEAEYRSPGIVMSEAAFKSFEVQKLLALGKEASTPSLIDRIFEELNEVVKARFRATRALVSGDGVVFDQHLVNVIKLHKKAVAKKPGDLEGLICSSGMMLCRLALRHGIRVPDQNYLPLRFAPWYST